MIPGSGRSPGEGNDYTFQYSCLESPMDRGRLQSMVCVWRGAGHKLSDTTERRTLSLNNSGSPLEPPSWCCLDALVPLKHCALAISLCSRLSSFCPASLQAVGCCSHVEENEVLIHALTRMSLGSVMMNERNHTHESHMLCGSICRKCPEQASL